MATTYEILAIEREYEQLLGNPRRSLSRFIEVSVAFGRMLAEPDPDRAIEVFDVALGTLHDPPAEPEAPMALELIRAQRVVAQRLGRTDIKLAGIERERRTLIESTPGETRGILVELARMAAAVYFGGGEVVAGFDELLNALSLVEEVPDDGTSDEPAFGELAEVLTDLILAVRRHATPVALADRLERVIVRLRQDHAGPQWTMWCLVGLAALRLDADDAVTARIYMRRAQAVFDDDLPRAAVLVAAWVATATDDPSTALEHFRSVLSGGVVDERVRLFATSGVGESLVAMGDLEAARAPLAEAIAHDIGDPLTVARCHHFLAEIAATESRFDEAYEHLMESRRLEALASSSSPVRSSPVSLTHEPLSLDNVFETNDEVDEVDVVDVASPFGDLASIPPPYLPNSGPPRFEPSAFRASADAAPAASTVPSDLIADALEFDWFELYFQSVCSNDSGRPVAAEALLRLRHPTRGVLQPTEFLAGVDAAVWAGELGEWVITQACRVLRKWRLLGMVMSVSVNIGDAQITPEFAALVKECVIAGGFSPECLILEMKERSLVAASTHRPEVLSGLREFGVRISVDNFGASSSSLDVLVQTPVDLVKLDRSTIEQISLTRSGRRDVDALVALSQTLGFDVVAEGVETVAQLDLQRLVGCDGAQGFIIGRPTPETMFTELITGLAFFDHLSSMAPAAA